MDHRSGPSNYYFRSTTTLGTDAEYRLPFRIPMDRKGKVGFVITDVFTQFYQYGTSLNSAGAWIISHEDYNEETVTRNGYLLDVDQERSDVLIGGLFYSTHISSQQEGPIMSDNRQGLYIPVHKSPSLVHNNRTGSTGTLMVALLGYRKRFDEEEWDRLLIAQRS